MFPRLRLKTKLVLAISGMVVAVVATLSSIYLSRLISNRVNEAYESADFVARQIFHATREALEIDLNDRRIDTSDPAAVNAAVQASLETDAGLDSLLQSIVGYSPIIYDVAIADEKGRALLHSDGQSIGQLLPRRQEFLSVRDGGLRQQLAMIYGAPRVYEMQIALERDGRPFGSVRIGISTIFLKGELQPQLNSALLFSGAAILIALLLSVIVSNFALRPLAAIGRRLDLMTAGHVDPAAETAAPRTDEVGAVTTKIDRLGRQIRDVKEVFSALKENLDQIMGNLQDGVMLFTRDWKTVLVSASVERFVGKPRSEMLGRGVHEIFSESTDLGRLVLTAFELHHSVSDRDLQEHGHRMQVSLDFIEERGERIGALLTIRDAESVRRIEDEIELSRRLAAIGRLTSGVAHEVKNPLNAIVVHLEVLRQKLQELDPDARRHLDVIGSEIQRLDRVVQTLVDFTRPVELRLTELDLRRLVDEVVLLASPEAQRQGVEIAHHSAATPLPANVDADLIKQAVLNVAINGVQAMENGGLLTLTTHAENDEAVIKIADQGAGIPPEVRDKIFNLYFTTKKTGTGIGLAMSYRVLQLHHGSIEFDSPPGGGTTFRLRLPRTEMQFQDAADGQKEVAAQGG